MDIRYPDGRIVSGSYDEISGLLNREVRVKEPVNGLSGKKLRRCIYCGDPLEGNQSKLCSKDECHQKAEDKYNRNWRRYQRAISKGKALKNRTPNGLKCKTCGVDLVGFQRVCCGKSACRLAQTVDRTKVRKEEPVSAPNEPLI